MIHEIKATITTKKGRRSKRQKLVIYRCDQCGETWREGDEPCSCEAENPSDEPEER